MNTVKNEVKESAPNIEEARTMIRGALAHPDTENDPEAWYVAGLVENKQFDMERIKEVMNAAPNEDVMYPALDRIFPFFAQADELDQRPNEKGKVKSKYRKDIKAILLANRPYYINAGAYFYEKENYRKACENFRFYGDMHTLSMFAGDESKFESLASDTNAIKYRYYAALSASLIPDHDVAIELYTEIKDLNYNEIDCYKQLANEYFQKEDTVGLINVLEQGTAKFPEDSYFILNIISINITRGEFEQAVGYLQKAIARSPGDAQLYDVLGLVHENNKEIDKAIENIKKALEINPDYADALSHLGRLYYNLGIESRAAADNISDIKSYNAAMEKVNDYFEEAIPYFEKSYSLNSKDSDAVFALRNIYYSLGNNEAYEKWDKIYSGE
ncbi:MAG: tetratricopeptide repeat protein [Dysgonamonadaceae bacterium]|nr:tetratricopeptide repeat protein [Dysgonamonadaceae bacterium]